MDYFDLLHKAQINNKNVKSKETRCYKATFTAPKKAEKSRVSSDNIKKFLARKEEEEREKMFEAKKKKEELLALRAMDKKAHKRVQTMLKRTKSANKSVMEDAIDNYNTKDTLEGPQQCDEDDYGYVSQEASAFYEKMMAKYENGPVENLKQMTREVKDLKAAKDRVKAALDREAEEQLHPTRKRKRKSDDGDANEDIKDEEPYISSERRRDKSFRESEKEEINEKPKKIPKKAAPPPVDFLELMKIAAKKQHEPIMVEKKVEKPDERPMTKKEKLEQQKLMERQVRKPKPSDKPSSSRDDVSASGKTHPKNNNKSSSDKSEPAKQKIVVKDKCDTNNQVTANNSPLQFKKKEVKFVPSAEKTFSIPKINSNGCREKNSNLPDSRSKPSNNSSKSSLPPLKTKSEKNVEKPPPKVELSDIDKEIEMLMKKKQMLMEAAKSKANQKPNSPSQNSRDNIQRQSQNGGSNKVSSVKSVGNMPVKKAPNIGRNETPVKGSINDRDKLQPKGNTDREKLQLKNNSDKERLPQRGGQPASKSLPGARKFSPPRYLPNSKPPPSLVKKKPQNKRVIDSESEYDSEMDDFIDDGPEECMDYSQHIKEIFGYDKSRYSYADEGECEEASFRTQMIEERRSARIGLMEDLEDIQREKEEKARAKMKKKMISKR